MDLAGKEDATVFKALWNHAIQMRFQKDLNSIVYTHTKFCDVTNSINNVALEYSTTVCVGMSVR